MASSRAVFSGRRLALGLAVVCACAAAPAAVPVIDQRPGAGSRPSADEALLDDIEHRTFDYFWKTANPDNGLVPDRYPTPSFSSIAAVGF
jgi:hypothetical protein